MTKQLRDAIEQAIADKAAFVESQGKADVQQQALQAASDNVTAAQGEVATARETAMTSAKAAREALAAEVLD